MPKNFNTKDVSILTRLGYVVIEDGVFKVTTAIAGHKPNDTISQDRAIELAEFLTPPMGELDRELVRVPSSSYISSNVNMATSLFRVWRATAITTTMMRTRHSPTFTLLTNTN